MWLASRWKLNKKLNIHGQVYKHILGMHIKYKYIAIESFEEQFYRKIDANFWKLDSYVNIIYIPFKTYVSEWL